MLFFSDGKITYGASPDLLFRWGAVSRNLAAQMYRRGIYYYCTQRKSDTELQLSFL